MVAKAPASPQHLLTGMAPMAKAAPVPDAKARPQPVAKAADGVMDLQPMPGIIAVPGQLADPPAQEAPADGAEDVILDHDAPPAVHVPKAPVQADLVVADPPDLGELLGCSLR